MIALEGRIIWRQKAPFHVQLELEKGLEQFRVPSIIQVQGRVVRVFRTDGRLAPGDHVAFKLWVCRPGDEPTGPAYVYHEDFVRATHMEAYLHGEPPKCELAAYEFTILNGPSDEPGMNVGQLEELLVRLEKTRATLYAVPPPSGTIKPRRWWHLWKG